jgi:hypothetical protein
VYRRECVRLLKQDFLDTCEDTGVRRNRTDFPFSACICQVTDLCNGEDFEIGEGKGANEEEGTTRKPSSGGRRRTSGSEPMLVAVIFVSVMGTVEIGNRIV